MILLLLLLLLPAFALADSAPRTLTWDAPTTRQNGVELPLEEIDYYTLACDTGAVIEIPAESPEGRHVVQRQDLMGADEYGQTDCTLVTTDTDGNVGRPSEAVTVWFDAPPSAPTNLLVIE